MHVAPNQEKSGRRMGSALKLRQVIPTLRARLHPTLPELSEAQGNAQTWQIFQSREAQVGGFVPTVVPALCIE